MKELNGFTPFNHGYLCQMLRSASDNELANILNDVSKEQQRRAEAKKNEYIEKIHDAIKEATDAGYVISFYRTSCEEHADYMIDENDAFLLDIELE
jgi:hypothetical protein